MPVTTPAVNAPNTPDARFAVQDAQAQLATAERVAAIQTANAASTAIVATQNAQATLDAAFRDATVTSYAVAPILTLGAATSTAQFSTQTSRETATAYPLTATPAAALMAASVARAEAEKQWQESLTLFWNGLLVLCAGIVLMGGLVISVIIWRSPKFVDNLANAVRIYMELQIARSKLLPFDKEYYQLWNPQTRQLELRRFDELNGPVVSNEWLDREWHLAVWRFCEAEAAIGTFAGDQMEQAGVLANDDDGWKLITDVMAQGGILSKRDRTLTRYATEWNLDRVRQERDVLPLPHSGKLPPIVNFAVSGTD